LGIVVKISIMACRIYSACADGRQPHTTRAPVHRRPPCMRLRSLEAMLGSREHRDRGSLAHLSWGRGPGSSHAWAFEPRGSLLLVGATMPSNRCSPRAPSSAGSARGSLRPRLDRGPQETWSACPAIWTVGEWSHAPAPQGASRRSSTHWRVLRSVCCPVGTLEQRDWCPFRILALPRQLFRPTDFR
jgi:hypothetical protein